jgi:alkylated DNA repair dioxygenase AlkB
MVNWYLGGKDFMSARAEDETELIDGAPIFFFSFGAMRTFHIRTREKQLVKSFSIEDNMLMVMQGAIQKEFLYEVPKMTTAGPCITITCRVFK